MLGHGYIKGRACHGMSAQEENYQQMGQVKYELRTGSEV